VEADLFAAVAEEEGAERAPGEPSVTESSLAPLSVTPCDALVWAKQPRVLLNEVCGQESRDLSSGFW
jgi:hypothetical protein